VSSKHRVADQETIRENKLALVERLADDLAHEIKNPLHSMVINLEVLRRRIARLEGDSNEDLLRYAGVLNAELERVSRRVELLLRLVRPNRESEDEATLAEIFEELRELVELECERHQVELKFDLPVAVVRARFPRASTRQMILSLILKTLDSIPPRGILHVTSDDRTESTRLQFLGTDSAGGSIPPLATLHDGSYLTVARTLAENLGGHLEVVETSNDMNDKDSAATRYVLTLPRE
jgi:signal transduction histidine kinase